MPRVYTGPGTIEDIDAAKAQSGLSAGAYNLVPGETYKMVDTDGNTFDVPPESVEDALNHKFSMLGSGAQKADSGGVADAIRTGAGLAQALSSPGRAAVNELHAAIAGEPTATGAALRGDLAGAAEILGKRESDFSTGAVLGTIPFSHTLVARGAGALLGPEATEAANKGLDALSESSAGAAGEAVGFGGSMLLSGGLSGLSAGGAVAKAGLAAEAALAGKFGAGVVGKVAPVAGRLAAEGALMGGMSAADTTFAHEGADALDHPVVTAEKLLGTAAQSAIVNMALGGALHVALPAVGGAVKKAGAWLRPLEGEAAVAARAEQARMFSPKEQAGAVAEKLLPSTIEGERAREELVNAPSRLRGHAETIEKAADGIDKSIDAVMKSEAPGNPDTHAMEAMTAAQQVIDSGDGIISAITGPNRKAMFEQHARTDNVVARQGHIEREVERLVGTAADMAAEPGVYQSPGVVQQVQAQLRDMGAKVAEAFPPKYRPLVEGPKRVPAVEDFPEGAAYFDRLKEIERIKTRNAGLKDLQREFDAEPDSLKQRISGQQYEWVNKMKQGAGRTLSAPYASLADNAPAPPGVIEISKLYDESINGMLGDAGMFGPKVAEAYRVGNKDVSEVIPARDGVMERYGTRLSGEDRLRLDSEKWRALFNNQDRFEGNIAAERLKRLADAYGTLGMNAARLYEVDVSKLSHSIPRYNQAVIDGMRTLEGLAREGEVAAAVKAAVAEGNEAAIPSILRAHYPGAPELAAHTTAIEKHAAAIAEARANAKRLAELVRDHAEVGKMGASVGNVGARLLFRRNSGGGIAAHAGGKLAGAAASMLPGGGIVRGAIEMGGEVAMAKAGMKHGIANEALSNVSAEVMQMAHIEAQAREAHMALDRGVDGFFKKMKLKAQEGYSPTVRALRGKSVELAPNQQRAKEWGKRLEELGASIAKANPRAISALTTYIFRDKFIGAAAAVERASIGIDATPMALTSAVGSSLETAPQVAAAMDSGLKNIITFLSDKLPVKPAPKLGQMARIDAGVSKEDADKFLRYFDAATNPLGVLDDLSRGHVSREAVEALSALYPATYKEMQDGFTARIESIKEPLPYKAQVLLGNLFGLDTAATNTPQFTARMQGAFMSDNQPQDGNGPGRGATRSTPSRTAEMTATPSQKLAVS